MTASEVDARELKQAVEHMHNCKARLIQSVPVRERFGDKPVWEGLVHVFELIDHPKVARAYVWSSPIEGSEKRRFYAVLHDGPVTGPIEAVRAAIVAEHQTRSHP